MSGIYFTFRDQLQGQLIDFLRSSGFDSSTTDLVRDITFRLSHYREEDVPLFPEVFILPKPQSLAFLSPGTQHIVLGSVNMSNGAETILKNSANLASQGWAVYVALIDSERVEYGLFRSQMHSYAINAEELMQDCLDESPSILIRNRGHLTVVLQNARKEKFTAQFTPDMPSEFCLISDVQKFIREATRDLPEDNLDRFQTYFIRKIMEVLQYSHGTLLAVYAFPENGKRQDSMEDGVWFDEPIDFATAYERASNRKDAQSLADLQSLEALLAGMIACDGIVVFGTKGTILAYRVFLKPNDEERKGLPDEGGGRYRTYSLMVMRLGEHLKAALIRSQDGKSECERCEV